MELALVVYLISLFDAVHIGVVLIFAIPCGVVLIACMINVAESRSKDAEDLWTDRARKTFKLGIIITPILTIFVWLVPDKETSYTMLAAYGVQTISESEQVQTVMGKSVEVFEQYMDQYLVEEKVEVEE